MILSSGTKDNSEQIFTLHPFRVSATRPEVGAGL